MSPLQRSLIPVPIVGLLLLSLVAADSTKPVLLPPDALDAVALLPAPPAAGTEEDKRDMAEVLRVQETRTAEEAARAKSEDTLSVFAFADILGPGFSESRYPKSAKLFAQLADESKIFSRGLKNKYNRPRPPFASDKVHPVMPAEQEGSYPSGHALRGLLFAYVLADAFPEKAPEIIARGRQIGYDRVVLGVHYPSDIAAGQFLGHNLYAKLKARTQYAEFVTVLRSESVPTPAQ